MKEIGRSPILISWKLAPWILVVGLMLLFFATSAFADTYNFFFTKPKKKSSLEKPADKNSEEEQTSEEDNNGNESQNSSTNPVQDKSTKSTVERGPIVIHNHNTFNAPNHSDPVSTVASANQATAMMGPRSAVSPWRFGLSAVYIPNSFSSPVFFNGGAYGGSISLAYVLNSYFTLNAFGGANYVRERSSALAHLGFDVEFYPFSSAPPWELSPLELGLLAGGSATLDHSGSVHGGARLNINFSPRFGLVAIGRVGSEYQLIEAGFITRL